MKSITCLSVWFCQNILEVLKLIPIFWRNILCVFLNKNLLRKVKSRVGDQNWRTRLRRGLTYRIKLPSMSGYLGFTFYWPVSIPDMDIEFTGDRWLTRNQAVFGTPGCGIPTQWSLSGLPRSACPLVGIPLPSELKCAWVWRRTVRETDRQAGWKIDKHVGKQAGLQVDRQTYRQTTDRLEKRQRLRNHW